MGNTPTLTELNGVPLVNTFIQYYTDFPWFSILVIMMLFDIATGTVASVYERRLSSKIGFRGQCKKVTMLLLVGMCVFLEQAILVMLPQPVRDSVYMPFTALTSCFFIYNEAISILENAKRTGILLPDFLQKSLIETLGKLATGNSNAETDDREDDREIEIKATVVTHSPRTKPHANETPEEPNP